MPDDAALLPGHVGLGGLDAEVLVGPRQLLHATIEEDEVVHQLQKAVLAAEPEQVLVELEAGVVLLVLLPREEVLLGRSDRAVAQALGVIAGQDQLHRAEEPGIELRPLVREVLADAVADAHPAVLEFQHADRDAVQVQHDVGAALGVAAERTSSARATSLRSGSAQSMRWTVSVTSPASVFTGTP